MWRSIGRGARSAACLVRGRRSSCPAPPRCERTPATQAHLEALDGADVVSVGPAGVITSSCRCSARAERRAAADRTGLLHSLAAARASKVAERSLGGEFTDQATATTGIRPSVRHICRSMRIAGGNVQADFCAVAAHMKCKTHVNLLASLLPGWLSQPLPFCRNPRRTDSVLLGFRQKESTHAMHVHVHAFRGRANLASTRVEQQPRRRRAIAFGMWMQRRWAALSRARGGAPGRCRRQ